MIHRQELHIIRCVNPNNLSKNQKSARLKLQQQFTWRDSANRKRCKATCIENILHKANIDTIGIGHILYLHYYV